MVGASDLSPEGRELEPWPVRVRCVLGKTLNSESASLHPGL